VINESHAVFLNDFGVAVTDGTTTSKGILDMPSEIIAGGMVLTTDYTLTVRASEFGAKKYGDALNVGGAAYTVRETRLIDDGTFAQIYLSKV
jgi:hypothetical protein